MKKIWFITGSARGLGKSLTEAVLQHGDAVAATARNPVQLDDLVKKYPDTLLPVKLDVTRPDQIREAVDAAMAKFGRIDVLVNNAGFGITGAAEAYTEEQVRSQLDTNLYAPIAVTRAILPIMRKQRSGYILQISSIGGRVASAGLTMYQAAKFGLGGFSEALANEVAHLGIHVISVEPGGFRTDWAGSSMTYAPKIEGYELTVGAMADLLNSGAFVPMGDPAKASRVMISLVENPHPPVRLVLGSESVGIIQRANKIRDEEFENWIAVSRSTDADDAVNFLDTPAGQDLMRLKQIAP